MFRHQTVAKPIVVLILTLTMSTAVEANVVGDTLNAANTFANPDFTGGAETIFQVDSGTVVNPGIELTQFATIHDVDVTEDSLTMTVVDNSSLSFTLYEAGTFDRYYYGLANHRIVDAVLASGDPALTAGLDIQVFPPGFELDVPDLFSTGIPVPQEFPNGALRVELGEGTDYGTLGVSLTIDLTTVPIPEPSSMLIACGLCGIALVHRRR